MALFAGHDLSGWRRWLLSRHVSRCGVCASTVQELQACREQMRDLASDLPEGVNWSRLTEEMTGNIRVGLAAGECIAGFEKSPRTRSGLLSNAAMVLAGATVVAVSALWIELPKSETDHLTAALKNIRFERIGKVIRGGPVRGSAVVLEASPFSLGIRENGGALTLLHPQRRHAFREHAGVCRGALHRRRYRSGNHQSGVLCAVAAQAPCGAGLLFAATGWAAVLPKIEFPKDSPVAFLGLRLWRFQ